MIFIILKHPMAKIVSDDVDLDLYLLFCTTCMQISIVEPGDIVRETLRSYKCSNCNSIMLGTDNPKTFVVDGPDEDKLEILANHAEVESIPGKDTIAMMSRIRYVDEVLKFVNKIEEARWI